MKEWLTPAEAGKIIGCRPQLIRELCKAGILPAIKSGNHFHIHIDNLKALKMC